MLQVFINCKYNWAANGGRILVIYYFILLMVQATYSKTYQLLMVLCIHVANHYQCILKVMEFAVLTVQRWFSCNFAKKSVRNFVQQLYHHSKRKSHLQKSITEIYRISLFLIYGIYHRSVRYAEVSSKINETSSRCTINHTLSRHQKPHTYSSTFITDLKTRKCVLGHSHYIINKPILASNRFSQLTDSFGSSNKVYSTHEIIIV